MALRGRLSAVYSRSDWPTLLTIGAVALAGIAIGYLGELIAADEFASPRQRLSLPAFAFGSVVLVVFGLARAHRAGLVEE